MVQELVERYRANRQTYLKTSPAYNELQLRNDFLNAFLGALGWDVGNVQGLPQHLREVVVEESIAVEGEQHKKNPDYTLRAGEERKFFVEAKKPSVNIEKGKLPAFQTRRYGWNAGMAISLLTNFEDLAFYDCHSRPLADDDVAVGRLNLIHFEDYVAQWDTIYDAVSRETVFSGRFDEKFASTTVIKAEPFGDYFLRQIESWHRQLAGALAKDNLNLSEREVRFLAQRLLNRIVFLRICEDRERVSSQALKEVQSYDDLKALFQAADTRYNSGLFDFIEDQLSLSVAVEASVLTAIFEELYFPRSPYDFAVVDGRVISEIYERFLARELTIDANRQITVSDKPEVAQSGGVVPTPIYIVNALIERALPPLCQGKSPFDLAGSGATLRIADISCGSGAFLVAAYEFLLRYCLEWYLGDGAAKHSDRLYDAGNGQIRLSLAEKRRILLTHIFGVDTDLQAVEITRFSLLLKVLEDESAVGINVQNGSSGQKALPSLEANIQCGNSLVDSTYYYFDPQALTDPSRATELNLFDWDTAFAEASGSIKFDLILGNPPYVRIQNLRQYAGLEADYYGSEESPYTTTQSDNYDKYFPFIERALSLLSETGSLAYVVPHKFFSTRAGTSLRALLASGRHLSGLVHFGVEQVFPGRLTYVCFLMLTKAGVEEFALEHVSDLRAWRYGAPGAVELRRANSLSSLPWVFVPPRLQGLFDRLEEDERTQKLNEVADIIVGVQTSRDPIYIVKPTAETETEITFFDRNGMTRTIERAVTLPSLLDAPLKAFGTPTANTRIIFPYWITIAKRGKQAILLSPAEMESQFPLCWAYLNAHKDDLETRSIQGKSPQWYAFGRTQSLVKFDGQPKLIWPVLSLEPRYAYDDNNLVFTGGGNGPYYSLRAKSGELLGLHYLLAVLSHPVLEMMVQTRGSVFQGGYVSHGKQFVQELPIRGIAWDDPSEKEAHDQIVKLSQAMIVSVEAETKATLPQERQAQKRRQVALKRQLNGLIEKLYGITSADLKMVEQFRAGEEIEDANATAEVESTETKD